MVQQKQQLLRSADRKLVLHLCVTMPQTPLKGVVQISHGMAEHKERYQPFLLFLAEHGYASVIHDHRGHGDSVSTTADYGYFYDDTGTEIVRDLYEVTKYCKDQFPRLPVYLVGHSMGTLVARNYLKQHDDQIDRLVLCGPPGPHDLVDVGLSLLKRMKKHHGDRYRARSLDKLIFASYNRKLSESRDKNRWISSVPEEVQAFEEDPKCGFTFTVNGFENLLLLLKQAYGTDGWKMQHPDLPILLLGGTEDPVIGGEKSFERQIAFLQQRGYHPVFGKRYLGKRHEILREDIKETVYQDILQFFETAQLSA